MKFREFMDLFNNWDMDMCVNDKDLKCRRTGCICDIMYEDMLCNYMTAEVMAFGFYDDELTVRVNCGSEGFE